MAVPESVYFRSLRCDLTWPTFSTISQEERELPLAYVMSVVSDPRNIELTLATIFRPHNSYCLHVDPKSDQLFRYVRNNRNKLKEGHPVDIYKVYGLL